MVQAGVVGLDTPKTNLGDATYLTNQLDFDISQEQSFQSPSKDNNNLLQQLQNGRRGLNLRTPRAALSDRRNLPDGLGGEFTPLLKNATRNSALRNGKENGIPQTPAFLKPGGLDNVPEELSPLPAMGSSIYGQDSRNGSYVGGTPLPQMDSSSATSTPVALLPRRNEGPGVLQDGNQLSLREQENVIDKIEKENFGLKLKIHFLEEALRKAGPGFSEAALKENTELKVDKVTMQKELHRYRKTLSSAERDVDLYRQQIIEMQEKLKRKHADAGQREELDRLRQSLQDKEAECDRLRDRLDSADQQNGHVNEYQDKIEDLEADLREKDRIIDDREDEVDNLKTKIEQHDNAILDLEDTVKKAQRRALELEEKSHSSEELAEARETIEDLESDLERQKKEVEKVRQEAKGTIAGLEQDLMRERKELDVVKQEAKETVAELEEDLAQQKKELDEVKKEARVTVAELEHEMERLKDEVEDAKEDRQTAVQEKERAEADLEELQDEMANKSITTKGLSRQIEEKANRLQDDLEDLRQKHAALEEEHADKIREIKKLQGKIEDLSQDSDVREEKLRDQLEIVQNKNNIAVRERENLASKLAPLQKELQQKTDEKDLLQVRHDALTSESASLQRDLARARTTIQELEDKLDQEKNLALDHERDLARSRATIEDLQDKLDHEKTLALNNERDVRDQYKGEIDRLHDDIEDLRADIREKQRLHDDENDRWAMEKRNLESERDRAEDRAAGLQRTIDRLQEAEGTLSGKEMKLQEALQSENDRHRSQEALLSRQIEELNEDVQARRKAFEDARSEISSVKEELRLSQREQKSLAEKIEGLEDEIEILQNSLDDESDNARQDLAAAKQDSETLKQQLRALRADLVKAQSISTDNDNHEQLDAILKDVEAQLTSVRQEKQNLQDQLATLSIEMHTTRSTAAKAEAERDELRSQLRALKEQEEETFRLDQERIDLRTAKMKLDNEVRQLREEKRLAFEQQEAAEKELQREITRANAEEARLSSQVRELRRKIKGSSEKELASAKRIIKHLEERINELEGQMTTGEGYPDAASQLEFAKQSLSSARKKEAEYIQREGAQKDVLKGLMRQIKDLERRYSNENDISLLSVPSPLASAKGSARKSEANEARQQLATAHQNLKDLRMQLKEVEREAARKLKAISNDGQARSDALETERDALQLDLDDALFQRDQLKSKNSSAEATITKLRSKIERLEKELQAERLKGGEDRSIVLERRDLHEMLRETQRQAEMLEVVVKERERTIANVNAAEKELRAKLERVRDERALQRTKVASAQEHIRALERQFQEAKESWEVEKKALTKGVRFPNMSMSEAGNESLIKQAVEAREVRHNKELRGLAMQIEFLRTCLDRETYLRNNAAFVKHMLQTKIDFFRACNKADLKLLGVPPRPPKPHERPSLKGLATMVIATERMKKMAEDWRKNLAVNQRLQDCLKEMRRKQGRVSTVR